MAKLIDAKDLRGERRERLVDAVPLSTPWTMFIEPTNSCNFRCKYCPTGDTALLKSVGRKNTLMPMSLFRKIVDDLRKFPRKLKMVNLYKDGESLLHPQFCEMVSYLKAAHVTESIWVKTNGSMLSPLLNDRLVSCGLDMIGISVQGVNAQAFMDISSARVDYENYRENVKDLFQRSRGKVKISVKIADVGLTPDDRVKFLEDFDDRCDFIAIEGLHGWSASHMGDWRMGTEQSFDGTPRTEKVACPLVLYMLTISANGDISICNDDWAHVHQIGNVSRDSLPEVWTGEKLRAFRMMHLFGLRAENKACGTCDYLAALPDSIDADRGRLINALR